MLATFLQTKLDRHILQKNATQLPPKQPSRNREFFNTAMRLAPVLPGKNPGVSLRGFLDLWLKTSEIGFPISSAKETPQVFANQLFLGLAVFFGNIKLGEGGFWCIFIKLETFNSLFVVENMYKKKLFHCTKWVLNDSMGGRSATWVV